MYSSLGILRKPGLREKGFIQGDVVSMVEVRLGPSFLEFPSYERPLGYTAWD